MTHEEAYTQTQELFAQLHALAHRIADACPAGPRTAKQAFATGLGLGQAHMELEALMDLMKESDG